MCHRIIEIYYYISMYRIYFLIVLECFRASPTQEKLLSVELHLLNRFFNDYSNKIDFLKTAIKNSIKQTNLFCFIAGISISNSKPWFSTNKNPIATTRKINEYSFIVLSLQLNTCIIEFQHEFKTFKITMNHT